MPASSLVVALDSPAAPSVEARKLVKRWLLGLSLECGATLDAPAGLGRLRVTSLFPVTASPARIDGATRITVEHAAEAPPARPHASAPPTYAAPPPPPPPAALPRGSSRMSYRRCLTPEASTSSPVLLTTIPVRPHVAPVVRSMSFTFENSG